MRLRLYYRRPVKPLLVLALAACAPPPPAPPKPRPIEPPPPPRYEIALHGCTVTDGKGYEDEDLRVPRGAVVHLQADPGTVRIDGVVAEAFPAHPGTWTCNDAARPIIVMAPAELAALVFAADELVAPTTVPGKVALGERLFQAKGCIVCHTNDGAPRFAPSWKGIWGTTVADNAGTQRTVDAAYIRESILAPQAFIVTGFPASMPSYEGLLSDLELESIAKYIEALK